jgi:hypothetical protein
MGHGFAEFDFVQALADGGRRELARLVRPLTRAA